MPRRRNIVQEAAEALGTEQARTVDDHVLDAMRYAQTTVPNAGTEALTEAHMNTGIQALDSIRDEYLGRRDMNIPAPLPSSFGMMNEAWSDTYFPNPSIPPIRPLPPIQPIQPFPSMQPLDPLTGSPMRDEVARDTAARDAYEFIMAQEGLASILRPRSGPNFVKARGRCAMCGLDSCGGFR